MAIIPVSGVTSLLTDPVSSAGGSQKTGDSFSNILSEAINNTLDAEEANINSGAQLLTGEIDNLHTATIDATKAELALQLTVQIRNRVLEAYNEVMRMQI